MITKGAVMGVLLDACPSFAPQWEAFLAEWQENADDLPLYVALGDFARHVIGIAERGETACLTEVFRSIERLHVEGDGYVREAATVGLLEDLQNRGLHATTTPDQFRQYLGPESAIWWDKLTRFWDHGEPMTDQ